MGWRKRRGREPDFFPWGFHVLDGWLQLKYRGGSFRPYFEDNRIRSVAIYGMGAMGRRLFEELKGQGIEVRYAIDRNAAGIHVDGLQIRTLEEQLPEVDAVVVTPVMFHEIEKALYAKMGDLQNVASIEDIVDYCLRKSGNG